MTENTVLDLEMQLNDFDPAVRAAALDALIALERQNAIAVEAPREVANMHAHTFFSFNAYGYSPTGLAWLAKKRGFKLMGTVDFDVLDAVTEFLEACDKVGVRGSTGIETRLRIPEFPDREFNSPGEPGVFYHMGIGFTSSRVPPAVEAIQNDLRNRAQQRNRSLVARVNAHMAPAAIDYDRDVLPLAPGGTPTERHIALAYVRAAEQHASDLTAFWAEKLDTPPADIAKLIGSSAALQNYVRNRLMKRGGVGYVQPGPDTFPALDDFHEFVVGCGALPCAAWLDGLSNGEQAYGELLELLIGKGAVALNIVPDRNWDLADPNEKAVKLQNLYDVVKLAQDLDLPLNIGTEMNSFGQKLIDGFEAPELAPVRQAFLDGAYFVYGHTAMQRAAGMGYQSAWAQSSLPTRRARNAFYTQAGYRIAPGTLELPVNTRMSPEEVLQKLN